MNVPEHRRAKCELGGEELDIDGDGVHQWTKGWAKNRSGGGIHGISLRETENRWACGYHIDMASRGLIGQKSMF